MENKKYLAKCDSHYGKHQTLIVKTHYSEYDTMTVCWKCHSVSSFAQRFLGAWLKLLGKDTEPF